MWFTNCLGSINYLDNSSKRAPSVGSQTPLRGFFSYFTRAAYFKVLRVFSLLEEFGDIFPIINVLQYPVNESLRTIVSFDPLKGV